MRRKWFLKTSGNPLANHWVDYRAILCEEHSPHLTPISRTKNVASGCQEDSLTMPLPPSKRTVERTKMSIFLCETTKWHKVYAKIKKPNNLPLEIDPNYWYNYVLMLQFECEAASSACVAAPALLLIHSKKPAVCPHSAACYSAVADRFVTGSHSRTCSHWGAHSHWGTRSRPAKCFHSGTHFHPAKHFRSATRFRFGTHFRSLSPWGLRPQTQ